jgi:uncharacterized membrane protein (DUF106 family)
MENKKGFSMIWFLLILSISFLIASKWNSQLTIIGSQKTIKELVNSVLQPVFGGMLHWNVYIGFAVIIGLTSLALTLSQKYLSNQAELKEIRKEQKYLQEEMKKYRDNPQKILEFQKKQLEIFPKTFELTMKPLLYTSVPVILLFRWFSDYFNPIFGGWWIFYYLIGSVIFSSIFRKVFDVA